MKITIEANKELSIPIQKLKHQPIKNFLSFNPTIAFDNHPSARGLKKEEEENKSTNLNINFTEKKNKNIKITLDSVESEIYNNEIFYTKNNDINNNPNNNCLSINYEPIKKQNTFTKEEEEFDKDITHLIQKRENSEIIINKFQKFANCKL